MGISIFLASNNMFIFTAITAMQSDGFSKYAYVVYAQIKASPNWYT